MAPVLSTAAAALATLNFRALLTLHSACVCMWMRGLAPNYMRSYWITFTAAFGGGVLSAILLNDAATPPALFASNDVGLIFTAVWWAINYSPARSIVVGVLSRPPVAAVARAALNALRAALVASRVDAAAAKFPGVVAAPLFIGTLAGAGGKLASDPMLQAAGAGGGRSEFASPSVALRSALAGAAAQYGLVHVFKVVTPAEGAAIITAIYVAHGLAIDLLGWTDADWTAAGAAAFHALSGVPHPAAAAAGGRRSRSRVKRA